MKTTSFLKSQKLFFVLIFLLTTLTPFQSKGESYQLGAFKVFWNSEKKHLSITHSDFPSKVLWETVKGHNFISAVLLRVKMNESNGSFTIKEKLIKSYQNQTILKIDYKKGELIFHGYLSSPKKAEQKIFYTFTLSETDHDHHLQLNLNLKSNSNHSFKSTLTAKDSQIHLRPVLTYASPDDEKVFGFGAQYTMTNMKGLRLPILSQEQGHGRGGNRHLTRFLNYFAKGAGGSWHTTYASIPFYLTSQGRSLFLENKEYCIFDFSVKGRASFEVQSQTITGRILAGKDFKELIKNFTDFSGRMKPLPDWVGKGAIVGLQGGEDRVMKQVDKLLKGGVPISAVWIQDWVGKRKTFLGQRLWWNWEIDRKSYPNFEEMVKNLKERGISVLTYINPYLVNPQDKGGFKRNLWQEAHSLDYLLKDKQGRVISPKSGSIQFTIVDLTNPKAKNWFKEIMVTNMINKGVSGWMADFAEGIPFEARPFSGESAESFHHQYIVEWAKLNHEVLKEAGLIDKALVFLRSAHTKSLSFAPLFWLGDQLVTWDKYDGLLSSLNGLISSGLSGFSLNHSDTGGYASFIFRPFINIKRSEELLTRWSELNAFTAVLRTHEGLNPQKGNIQIYSNQRTIRHFSKMARLYKGLSPYRNFLMKEAFQTGLPLVRPLFLHYPNKSWAYKGENRKLFLLGSELLVAPVLYPGRKTVKVTFPPGRWINIWTSETYGDPHRVTENITLKAPLGFPAAFIKYTSKWKESILKAARSAIEGK